MGGGGNLGGSGTDISIGSLKLQQLFPDLTFCHSTPALYEWMELHQPDVFTGICLQVQAGKWEIVGGHVDRARS